MTLDYTTQAWGGWQECAVLSNGIIEMVIPLQIGIRIMRFAFSGGTNMFAEFADDMGKTGGDVWRLYGGHRLWHAPETRERTYSLDNAPIRLTREGDTVTLHQAPDHAGIEKSIAITLSADSAQATLLHTLTNRGVWAVRCASWSLNVMAPGGTAIIPLPSRGNHETDLLPNTRLTLWSYTDMADPRWTWGRDYVLLRQDAHAAIPQKIGLMNPHGWAGYWNEGQLFVARAAVQPDAEYPDHGSSHEFFTNFAMLEVETLAPMVTLEVGASVQHTETWQLYADVPAPTSEAVVTQKIVPLL